MSFNIQVASYVPLLQWRHNGRNGVSNNQPHDSSLNYSRRRSKKTSKLRVTGLCWGVGWGVDLPVTGELPAQMASNADNVCIWWRHHALGEFQWLRLSFQSICSPHLAVFVPEIYSILPLTWLTAAQNGRHFADHVFKGFADRVFAYR